MSRTWPCLVVLLSLGVSVAAQTRPVDTTEAALDRPIRDLLCVGLTLAQTVELISRKLGVACRVDSKARAEVGDPDKVLVGNLPFGFPSLVRGPRVPRASRGLYGCVLRDCAACAGVGRVRGVACRALRAVPLT